MRPRVIVICGPTASGKSAVGIEIAKRFDGEIISADSMQIYAEMNIGTATPTTDEMCGIVHRMINTASVCENYNVTRYVADAEKAIEQTVENGKIPVIVGGTGLYIDSLINNTDFSDISNDYEYRKKLEELAGEKGNAFLLQMLSEIDSVTASRLHPNDLKRIIRALEVYKTSGRTISDVQRDSIRDSKYNAVFIGLNFRNRENLYQRINRRTDSMFDNGLVEEARKVYSMRLSSTSKSAIGYSELFDYFEDRLSLDEARELIKKKSRNYAKRQLTWFRKNKEVHWFYQDDYTERDTMLFEISNLLAGEILK